MHSIQAPTIMACACQPLFKYLTLWRRQCPHTQNAWSNLNTTDWRKSVLQQKDMREILEERRRARDSGRTPAAAHAQPAAAAAPAPEAESEPVVIPSASFH